MDWTTFFSKFGPQRALPGIVTDAERLDGIDIARERTNRVQLTATSDEAISGQEFPDLAEFLAVAARALRPCTAGGRWSAMLLTVRQESGSVGAFLIDDTDRLARSGVLVLLSINSLELAASEMPFSEDDPDGFERASRSLQDCVRQALRRAASTEPALTALRELGCPGMLPLLVDLLGETDPADYEALFSDGGAG